MGSEGVGSRWSRGVAQSMAQGIDPRAAGVVEHVTGPTKKYQLPLAR